MIKKLLISTFLVSTSFASTKDWGKEEWEKETAYQFSRTLNIGELPFRIYHTSGDGNACLTRAFLKSLYPGEYFNIPADSVYEILKKELLKVLESDDETKKENLKKSLVLYFEKTILPYDKNLLSFSYKEESFLKHIELLLETRKAQHQKQKSVDTQKESVENVETKITQDIIENISETLKINKFCEAMCEHIGESIKGEFQAPSELGRVLCALFNRSLEIYTTEGQLLESYGKGERVKLLFCPYMSPELTGSDAPNHYATILSLDHNILEPDHLFLERILCRDAELLIKYTSHNNYIKQIKDKNIKTLNKKYLEKKQPLSSIKLTTEDSKNVIENLKKYKEFHENLIATELRNFSFAKLLKITESSAADDDTLLGYCCDLLDELPTCNENIPFNEIAKKLILLFNPGQKFYEIPQNTENPKERLKAQLESIQHELDPDEYSIESEQNEYPIDSEQDEYQIEGELPNLKRKTPIIETYAVSEENLDNDHPYTKQEITNIKNAIKNLQTKIKEFINSYENDQNVETKKLKEEIAYLSDIDELKIIDGLDCESEILHAAFCLDKNRNAQLRPIEEIIKNFKGICSELYKETLRIENEENYEKSPRKIRKLDFEYFLNQITVAINNFQNNFDEKLLFERLTSSAKDAEKNGFKEIQELFNKHFDNQDDMFSNIANFMQELNKL